MHECDEVVGWVERHERLPQQHGTEADEDRLAQRYQKWKRALEDDPGSFTKELRDRLETLEQRFGKVSQWMQQCDEAVAWVERHGRIPRRSLNDKTEDGLARWFRNCLADLASGACTQEQREQVEGLLKKDWQCMYDKVASFADRQKRLPRCRSNRQEERCLACWLHRCDQEWVVGAQRAALDELLGRFGPDAMRAAEFRRNAISVNSFLELHGRWPRRLRGMGDAAAKEEHRLAEWVKNEGATRTSWKLAVLADFPALLERFKLFSLHVQRQCSDQQLATSCSMDDPGA